MAHEIHRVTRFEKLAPFILRVEFEDGTCQMIDFRPVLIGELYGPLKDLALFEQVQLDREAHTLVWPNGADFDPAVLHNWAEVSAEFEALAQTWAVPAK